MGYAKLLRFAKLTLVLARSTLIPQFSSRHVEIGLPVFSHLPIEVAEEHDKAWPERLVAQLQSSFFWRQVPLLAVALLASCDEVVPRVSSSLGFGTHVINGQCILAAAIDAAVVVPLEDIVARKIHPLVREINVAKEADNGGKMELSIDRSEFSLRVIREQFGFL